MKRLAATALLLGTLVARACPLSSADGALVQQGGVQLAWRTEPATIANGQPFVLRAALCPQTAQLLRVDATMPEHRHGMNYRPTLKPLGPGVWQVEGMLWHMAGRWELRWDVLAEGRAEVLRASVMLR